MSGPVRRGPPEQGAPSARCISTRPISVGARWVHRAVQSWSDSAVQVPEHARPAAGVRGKTTSCTVQLLALPAVVPAVHRRPRCRRRGPGSGRSGRPSGMLSVTGRMAVSSDRRGVAATRCSDDPDRRRRAALASMTAATQAAATRNRRRGGAAARRRAATRARVRGQQGGRGGHADCGATRGRVEPARAGRGARPGWPPTRGRTRRRPGAARTRPARSERAHPGRTRRRRRGTGTLIGSPPSHPAPAGAHGPRSACATSPCRPGCPARRRPRRPSDPGRSTPPAPRDGPG